MSAYKKYINFQCPTCFYKDGELGRCVYGVDYKHQGMKFKGTGRRPCPNYKRWR